MLQDVLQFGHASAAATAYTKNHKGHGPAWANSLFEDNAEYGLGMFLGAKDNKRKNCMQILKIALKESACNECKGIY